MASTTTTTTTTTTSTTTTTTIPWYLAASYILNTGNVGSGSLSDTYSQNGTYFEIDEVIGNPGFDIEFYFENLSAAMTSFDIHLDNSYYEGNPAHTKKARKWNFTTGLWEDFTTDSDDFPSRSTPDDYTFSIESNVDYVSGGQFRFKIYHNFIGTPTHNLYIDYLWLEDTVGPASDPEIIFKYKKQNTVFKRDTINKIFKRDEIQKVFKYEIKTTSKS